MSNVFGILKARYKEPEYVLMAEVSNATGFARSNSADFIAVSLWPSRGLTISTFELKSSRTDWLKEFKNPGKAEAHFKYADYFWLLTDGPGIANINPNINEIPETWGWMEIQKGKLKIRKEAPKLSPAPIDRHYLCAMLRRADSKDSYILRSNVQEAINNAREEGLNKRDNDNIRKIENYERILKIVTDFESASGVKMDTKWDYNAIDPKKVGAAIKVLSEGGMDKFLKELIKIKNYSNSIAKEIDIALGAIQEFTKLPETGQTAPKAEEQSPLLLKSNVELMDQ